ncbi:unnamed protein product [Vicia faba]|uniref:GTD-binding domain-containing protein n=1 Tax=Vicia faba TaxID=3906 RepID=A0AAV0ZUR4_VICFA|nr:unnamed protein product [Vicia faba]
MALEESDSWSLGGIIGSFIDLFVAYVLLCGSTFAFFVSKFLRLFGFYMPCPCKGVLGYRNSYLCFHMLLFEWPLRKICSIQVMAMKRFPFDLVWVKKGHSLDNINDEKTCDNNSNRIVELEDESSSSGPRLQEIGYDVKGKGVLSLKRRSGFRRRKRSGYDCGKIDSVIRHHSFQSDVTFTSTPCDGSSRIIKDKSSQSSNSASGKEESLQYYDQTSHDLDEKTCHSYEFNASIVESLGQGVYSSSLEHYSSATARDNDHIVGNEESRIKMYENMLEEEKAAYAALYLELEKERAAAVTAADEAMAMILRLQEEKALMEMEMRQYDRLVEERVAYDEEEMSIMQEILIRREKENLFLEKELESYRQMCLTGNCESKSKSADVLLSEWKQRSPLSFEIYDDPLQTESVVSNVKGDFTDTEHGEEPEKNTRHLDQACGDRHSSFNDTESDVLDVHVIDDNIEHKETENLSSSSYSTLSDKPMSTHLERASCSDADSKCKSIPFDTESNSPYLVHNEKLRIDNEIEVLGERLRTVKHEKEKLTLFADKGENEKGQLKLLDEIAARLQQIKQLRKPPARGASLPPKPARGASLPPSWTQVSERKRRSQSVTLETCESS